MPAEADPIRDDELDALFAPLTAFRLAILAVSGGADSVALMHLAHRWSSRTSGSIRLIVATIDHGLREGSGSEASWVCEEARALGLDAVLLAWSGDKPVSGIQDAARVARYSLLGDLARARLAEGPVAIVTAHTEDDQAETLLMRLARGSGIDGLAAMSDARDVSDGLPVTLLRAFLAVPGARLRATLAAAGRRWIDDPSNDAERFERVRIRKARAQLGNIGLTNDRIALSARRLRRAQEALEAGVGALRRDVQLELHGGAFASFERASWQSAPAELRLRLLARLIVSFGGQAEAPRLVQLEALIERMADPGFDGATLAGAVVSPSGKQIRVLREAGREALQRITLAPGATATWDGRFRVHAAPESPAPIVVCALGAPAFAELRGALKATDLPAKAAATLPAFWQGEALILAPHLAALPGAPEEWQSAVGLYSAEFLG